MKSSDFDRAKEEILHNINNGIDLSPKGSIDHPVRDLVFLINKSNDFVTTSSCSGRISLYCNLNGSSKGVKWLAVVHGQVSSRIVEAALSVDGGDWGNEHIFLKCEPFILHVRCRDTDSACWLHELVVGAGFRESGITLGKRKTMLAVRTTAFALEVPVASHRQLIVSQSYLDIVLEECNRRLRDNFERLDKLLWRMKNGFQWPYYRIANAPKMTNSNNFLLNRWGHVAISLSWGDVLVVGGCGLDESNTVSRALPSFIVPKDHNNGNRMQIIDSVDPYVHAAGAQWLDGAVLFGGRSSPEKATDSVRIITRCGEQYTIKSVEVLDTGGHRPSPRWGHTLTKVTDTAFLLFGGRDLSNVFGDAYLLLWEPTGVDGTAAGEGECGGGGCWRWVSVESAEGRLPGKRFFHAASAVTFADELNAVVVTGGLCSIEDPLQRVSGGLIVWYPGFGTESIRRGQGTWTEILRFGGSDDLRDDSMGCEERNDGLRLETTDMLHVFGHTLTNVGGKTLILAGGTSFSRPMDSVSNMLCIHLSGWNSRSRLCDEVQELGPQDVLRHKITLFSSKSSPSSGPLPCGSCRVHHQAHFFDSDMLLMLLGGGSACMAFGTHFCTTLLLDLSMSNTNAVAQRQQEENLSTNTSSGDVRSYSHSRSKENTSPVSSVGSVMLVEKSRVKAVKSLLERMEGSPCSIDIVSKSDGGHSWIDKTKKITAASVDIQHVISIDLSAADGEEYLVESSPASTSCMAIPLSEQFSTAIRSNKLSEIHKQNLTAALGSVIMYLGDQPCRLSTSIVSNVQLQATEFVRSELRRRRIPDDAVASLPRKFETVGDVLLLPQDAMTGPHWDCWVTDGFWKALCECVGAAKVARYAVVDSGPRRESRVRLVYPPLGRPTETGPGSQGWVRVCENGIVFQFDITRVMFCSGNVTERMRMAKQQTQGETIVDLYCGVGYYTMPFLVHGRAAFVHAFEWNPNSITSLKCNLSTMNISPSRYAIYEGDNRITSENPAVHGVADRVCLGLLPSSEDGWPIATRCLKTSGGVLHVHMNVNKGKEKDWVAETCAKFEQLFELIGKPMEVVCEHLERVKSYAPLVYHVVADLKCSPRQQT